MHAPNGPITPVDKSRELQRGLYLAAKRSRSRRFHALYDRIFRPDILWRAWQEVRENEGSAGVDGVTVEDVERQGATEFLEHIRQDLMAGHTGLNQCYACTFRNRTEVSARWVFRPFGIGWYNKRAR